MRRSYDPHYGSREQLRDSAEHGMKVMRERDALKTENEQLNHGIEQVNAINTELNWRIQQLTDEVTELKALIAYITEGE
jgi:peptidoglycan hydrolase CwlO-like protein